MPKKIQPVMGIPIQDALAELRFDLDGIISPNLAADDALTFKAARSILKNTVDYVNPDVCITEHQKKLVYNNALRGGLFLKNTEENIDVLLADITILINSFRLACRNCLNKECPTRDYDEQVTEE